MSITPHSPADFDPAMGNYADLKPFRFWCQKVLPLVYDESLSYYELLCKVIDYLNKTMEDVGVLHDDVDALHTAYQQLQNYVNTYFATLDVQNEINNKLDVMAADGTLDRLLLPYFNAYKNEINQIVATQNSNIAGQQAVINTQNTRITELVARMDEFAALPDGSTAGDAELLDIRIGADGVTYNSAGNAVRGQYNNILGIYGDAYKSIPYLGIISKPNGINLFDQYSDDIETGKFYNPNGGTQGTSASMGCIKIEIPTLGTYSFLGATSFYGTSSVIKVPCFKASDNSFLGYKYGTLDSSTDIVSVTGFNTMTTEDTIKVGYSFKLDTMDTAFWAVGTYEAVPEFKYYLDPRILTSDESTTEEVANIRVGQNGITYPSAGASVRGQFQMMYDRLGDAFGSIPYLGIVNKPGGYNLFDQYSSDIVRGKFFSPVTSIVEDNSSMGYLKIKIPSDGSYSFLGATSFFGAQNVIKVPCFKASDGTFLSYKYGTLDPDTNIVTVPEFTGITTEPEIIIAYSFKLSGIGTAFWCAGTVTEVPDFKYTLDQRVKVTADNLDNSLIGKQALFFGDSICAGQAVPEEMTDYYGWGWAGRLAVRNNMDCLNFGINGASITAMVGRSCIAQQVTAQIANYPDADYIILEGGTNDADIIETQPELGYTIGTYDPDDYASSFDMSTFCGSMEAMLRNVITHYPDKKIGYIIPLKMGQFAASLSRRRQLFEVAKGICKKWGVAFIDIWEGSTLNPKLIEYYDPSLSTTENIEAGKAYVDGQHPTDVGYDYMVPMIEEWIRNM